MSGDKRVITVFGATGGQGGSVLKALVQDGTFAVRAVTRDPNSSSAQALVADAVVVKADVNDEQSLERAVAGSYGVFAVTNYWDPSTGPKEEELAVRLAEISFKAGVKVYIWAGLPNVERISAGKYAARHFSGKARAWDQIKALGFPSAVSVEAPAYFSNFEAEWLQSMGFSKHEDGSATFDFPILEAHEPIPFFDIADLGWPVLAVLEAPHRYNGKRIVFSSNTFNLPLKAYQEIFTKATGTQTTRRNFSYDQLATFSKDFADVCLYIKEYGYFTGEADEIDATEVTAAPFTPFEQWLRKSSIPGRFE